MISKASLKSPRYPSWHFAYLVRSQAYIVQDRHSLLSAPLCTQDFANVIRHHAKPGPGLEVLKHHALQPGFRIKSHA